MANRHKKLKKEKLRAFPQEIGQAAFGHAYASGI